MEVLNLTVEQGVTAESEKASIGIKPYLLPVEHTLHVPPHVALVRMDDEIKELKFQLIELQKRNHVKDNGKKFEGSYTRTVFIMLITYITLCCYMYVIHISNPFLNAIVPTLGFNLSTWSLPWIKKIWIHVHNYKRHLETQERM